MPLWNDEKLPTSTSATHGTGGGGSNAAMDFGYLAQLKCRATTWPPITEWMLTAWDIGRGMHYKVASRTANITSFRLAFRYQRSSRVLLLRYIYACELACNRQNPSRVWLELRKTNHMREGFSKAG
uniref:Uncharacterized protein n=1 Tax=Anopheles culicifacies TaxID=139723 RepID=A0A182M8A0_9DIPT